MILRFGPRTPSVQVQVSRLNGLRRQGWGTLRPRGESLPNTPKTEPPPLTTWSFFLKNPTSEFERFFDNEPREPWESDPDAWKR